MKIIQSIKSPVGIIIIIVIVLVIIAVIYFSGNKDKVTPITPTSNTSPPPPNHDNPDIGYTVKDFILQSINFTASVGGESITGSAAPSSPDLTRSIGSTGYIFTIHGNPTAKTITMTISHIVTSPNVHYAEDKKVMVQF